MSCQTAHIHVVSSHKQPVTHWPFICRPLEGESQDRLLRQTWSHLGRTPTFLGTQNMILEPAQLPRVDLGCVRWSRLVTLTQTTMWGPSWHWWVLFSCPVLASVLAGLVSSPLTSPLSPPSWLLPSSASLSVIPTLSLPSPHTQKALDTLSDPCFQKGKTLITVNQVNFSSAISFKHNFIHFLAVLSLCCCSDFSLVAKEQELLSNYCGRAPHCGGFSCWGPHAPECAVFGSSVGSVVVAPRLQSTGLITVVNVLSCFAACGIFPDQGSNPCLLHCQADSLPLSQQGNPGLQSWCSLELLCLHLRWIF